MSKLGWFLGGVLAHRLFADRDIEPVRFAADVLVTDDVGCDEIPRDPRYGVDPTPEESREAIEQVRDLFR